ncbi:MAG: hypothetical protein AAB546_01105 [Patescibacteria group bacterium]
MNDAAQNQNNLNTNNPINPEPISPVVPSSPDPFISASSAGSDVPPPPPPVINGDLTSSGPNATDVVEPSFIPTYPKQGSGNGRLIGAFMGLLVLVVAGVVGVGIITNPKPTEKSKASAAAVMCPPGGCDPNNYCWVATTTNECLNIDGSGQTEGSTESFAGNTNWDGVVCYTCTDTSAEPGVQHCTTGTLTGGNSALCGGGTTPTSPPGGEITEWCDDVKAFDSAGNQLGNNALSSLVAGDVVTFGIKGQPTGRDYNRGRFTINGGERETSYDREAGIGFALDYTIPEGITSFNIKGAVHHQAKDRWINKQKDGSDCKLGFNLSTTIEPTPTDTAATPTPTATPTLPPEIAQCRAITIYDTEWNILTAADLATLKAGDVIRVSVSGNPDAAFDQARFIINGTTRDAVTQKKPNTQEFYDEYTIPTDATTFSVSAQLHHVTLDIWI